MVELEPRSAKLVQALVDEGMETGPFEIDSMRYAQMELLGQELSRQVQQALAQRQGQRMALGFACPTCGRECGAKQ